MPVNPISVAIAWLATHLVMLSLLGFLLAGLFVAGVIETPGQSPEAAAGRSGGDVMPAVEDDPGNARARRDENRVASNRPEEVLRPQSAKGASEPSAGPGAPARKQPRMIGGSLPLFDQSRLTPPKAGPIRGEVGGSFRPPGEGSQGPAGMTREDLLQDARRAFWNGDFEAAEAAYMVLVSEYPADADAFGELGNLYQAMGKPELALDAYYEAAQRLQAAGEQEKFGELVELLRREGDERAERLRP